MTIEEKQEILVGIYRKALGLGVVKTVKEFAEALEMNVSGVSSALNGSEKHLTKSLITKARRWEERTFPGGELPKQEKRPDVVIPAETLDLYNNMARAIADLSDILRRAGISVGVGSSIQKNFYRDGK